MPNNTQTSNTATKFNFQEFMKQTLAPIVKAGKYDGVKIKEVKEFPIDAQHTQPMVGFTYQLADGRTIYENRFEQGLRIMVSHLREQLGLQDTEVNVADLLTPGKITFSIWVEKVDTITRSGKATRVTNIHFLKPLEQPADEKVDATEDTTTTDEGVDPEVLA